MGYCTAQDIYDVFLQTEVDSWVDPSGVLSSEQRAARLERAIAYATAEIDDALRGGPYVLPLTGTSTGSMVTITNIAATLAGVWLYEARGVVDFNPDTGAPNHRLTWKRTEARNVLRDIRSGLRELDCARVLSAPTSPGVVR